MIDIALSTHIQSRLAIAGFPCGRQLISHYTILVKSKEQKITPEDALATWLHWLEESGGQPTKPLTLLDWADQTHERIAAILCEVARYYTEKEE